MLRFATACLAFILVTLAMPQAGTGQQSKPKTGDTAAVDPADRIMYARTRTNVRSGPGTDHAKVGLLKTGERVRVTGKAGDWLRIEGPDGAAAFVHGPLLFDPKTEAATLVRFVCQGYDEIDKEFRDHVFILDQPICGAGSRSQFWIRHGRWDCSDRSELSEVSHRGGRFQAADIPVQPDFG